MEIRVRYIEDACIIEVEGSVNIYNVHELKDAVYATMEKKTAACILSLRKVAHIDSSGIGTLISLNAMLARQGLAFCIVRVPPHIMQILELTRTISILPTENTLLEALLQAS
jgi:anti-anti-sigma factor